MRKSSISDKTIRKAMLKLIRERALHVFCIQQRLLRISQLFPIDVFVSGNEDLADEYRSLIAPIIIEKNKILKDDEEDALKYFHISQHFPESNLKKLVNVLKPLIAIVIITAIVSVKADDDKQTSKQDLPLMNVTYEIFRPFLNILEKEYVQGYEEVSQFIDNAVNGNIDFFTLLGKINSSTTEIPITHFFFYDDYIKHKQLMQPISAFDTAIYYATITFFHDHSYHLITPQSIFYLLSGEKRRENNTSVTTEGEVENTHTKIGARLRSKIENSIMRLQNIDVALPVTSISYEEALKYQKKIDDVHRWNVRNIIHWCILSFMGIEYRGMSKDPICFSLAHTMYQMIADDNGHTTHKLLPCGAIRNKKIGNRIFCVAFSLLDIPPLYEEAKEEHSLLFFDIDLFNTPLKNTEENIVLKCYLLRRITLAKSMNVKELLIDFNEIYKHLGKEQPTSEMTKKEINSLRVKLHELRKKTKELLSFWSQKGVYSSFHSNTKNITMIF